MNNYIKKVVNYIFKFQRVRDWMIWGTYGKTGREPLKFVILKNMSDEHIEAILKTQPQISDFYRKEFGNELRLRKKFPEFSRKETI
jgi:hypothetical protein